MAKKNNISINQRIPLAILEVALISYLNNDYSNEYITEQLKLDFGGENRLKKALAIVNKIILKSPLDGFIIANKDLLLPALKNTTDRNIILIALLNAAYPFSFDVLRTFGKYFSVQDTINTASIIKAISNIYGGNRATENGIYSVVPMFVEANFFQRERIGVYSFSEKQRPLTEVSLKVFQESLKLYVPHFNDSVHFGEPYLYFIKY